MTASSPPTTLLSLPPELLHLLTTFLPPTSLPALSLACHHLRAIAQPHLLSTVRVHSAQSYLSALFCLLRNAHLRHHVAAIQVSCSYRRGMDTVGLLGELRRLWREEGWDGAVRRVLDEASPRDRGVVRYVFGDGDEDMFLGRDVGSHGGNGNGNGNGGGNGNGAISPLWNSDALAEYTWDAAVVGISPGKVVASLVLLCTQSAYGGGSGGTLRSLSVEFPEMTPVDWQPVYELNTIFLSCLDDDGDDHDHDHDTETSSPPRLPRIEKVAITRVQNRASCIVPETCPTLLQLPGLTTLAAGFVNFAPPPPALLPLSHHHHRQQNHHHAGNNKRRTGIVLPASLRNLHLAECATPAYALQAVLAHGTTAPLETLTLSRCQARFFQAPWQHHPPNHHPQQHPPQPPNPHIPNNNNNNANNTNAATAGAAPLDLDTALSKHAPTLQTLELDMYMPAWEGELAYAPDWRSMALAVNFPPVLARMDNLTRLKVEFAVLWGSVGAMRAWGAYRYPVSAPSSAAPHSSSSFSVSSLSALTSSSTTGVGVVLPRSLRELYLTERWYAHQRLYGLYYDRTPTSTPAPTTTTSTSTSTNTLTSLEPITGCASVLDYRAVVLSMVSRVRHELADTLNLHLALDYSMWVRDGDRLRKDVVQIEGAEVLWREELKGMREDD